MFDRSDNHPAGGACIAQRVVMAVWYAKETSEPAETMVVQVGPGAPGDAHAVEPTRLDLGLVVNAARGRERALVEQ